MCKYAIIDLEMCKVPKRLRCKEYHFANEIIQIGVVLLNENLEIQDEYNTFVHPEYGVIDEYIEHLTGISNEDVSDAPNLEHVLKELMAWIPSGTKMVSWSNSDKLQLYREVTEKVILLNGIDALFKDWIDCQRTFSQKMHCDKCYNLTEALVVADINFQDGAHDGLVDAYNTALLFAKMQKEDELVLSKYYRDENDNTSSSGFSLGSLLGDIGNLLLA